MACGVWCEAECQHTARNLPEIQTKAVNIKGYWCSLSPVFHLQWMYNHSLMAMCLSKISRNLFWGENNNHNYALANYAKIFILFDV